MDFRDNYPKVEYSKAGFLVDTKTIQNLFSSKFWCIMMQVCLTVLTFIFHSLDRRGYDIRTTQELFGHKEVKTTMIYTHVLNWRGKGVKSPADDL